MARYGRGMVSREGEVADARGLPSRVRATLGGWASAVRAALTTPGVERAEGLLMLKAAVATVLAWQLAVHLLDSPTPFYAPMAALLVVDRTMVRSIGASARRVAAVILGMSIAWLVGSLVGVTWWSMVPVLMAALLIARWPLLGDHGIQVPTMALLSLLTVKGTDVDFTYLTIVETVLGGVVGVAVNAVVLAPMHLDEPRDALRDLTTRVQDLLKDMASGLREGFDAHRARGWYDSATDLGDRVPEVLSVVETGRESTRFNWRHRLRPARIDWEGYTRTVEAVRRAQWQVGSIARTLVDAADEAARHPAPSASWLEDYAGVLDEIGDAISDFGVWTEQSRAAVEQHVHRALASLDDLSEQVRLTPLDDPRAWPTYGALVLEAERLARELQESNADASVPTDSGPIRSPLAETVPAVGQLQQQIEQVPLVGEHLPRIIEAVSGRTPPTETVPPPDQPPERASTPADGEGSAPRS